MGYTLKLALHQKELELHAQESAFFDGQKLLVLRSIRAMGPRYRPLPVLQHNLSRPRCFPSWTCLSASCTTLASRLSANDCLCTTWSPIGEDVVVAAPAAAGSSSLKPMSEIIPLTVVRTNSLHACPLRKAYRQHTMMIIGIMAMD